MQKESADVDKGQDASPSSGSFLLREPLQQKSSRVSRVFSVGSTLGLAVVAVCVTKFAWP